MKLQLSTNYAIDLLRQDEYAGWSYKGATALVEHLENLEDELGEEINFNCIDFRCEYSEYHSVQDWLTSYYGMSLKESLECAGIDHDEDEDEIDALISEFILNRGTLVEFEGGVIVSSNF
jgi:hypothetical protein